MEQLIHPPKCKPGDKVAVLSPSFAAPAIGPGVHEQAMARLLELTGLVPVEFPTTRKLGAPPEERAADFNAALADPEIRAILATIGGEDQIRVVPFLDAGLLRSDPKPFLGYSDNTNILNWMWRNGVASFYGGSTQVHLGSGPGVDPEHLASLRAALITGGDLQLTQPEFSEDFGVDWADPRALTEFGDRQPTEPWFWAGPRKTVSRPTWGGCLDVLVRLALADRLPSNEQLKDTILLLETSESLVDEGTVSGWLESLGQRGLLRVVSGVVAARPPVTALGGRALGLDDARDARTAQRDAIVMQVQRYNPDAVVCVGPSFGHTRPQWIVPYGGAVTLDGRTGQVVASYN